MLYNRSKNRKLNDKKILHKVKKRWVVVSSALLMTLGGVAAATHTQSVHADVNNPNPVKSKLNQEQEKVSQLTDKEGSPLNSQESNLRSDSLSSAEVTSHARQLHSQILRNRVMTSADSGIQKSSSSSVGSENPNVSLFDDQASNYDKSAKTVINNNQSRIHSLGSTDQAYGSISIEDIDIHNGNKDVNNGFSSITKPAGTPFTKADQASFTKITPPGYIFDNVISAPTHFIANQNQVFKIAVVPRNPNQSSSGKILLEYTDTDDGDFIVGKVHKFYNAPGTPFSLIPWEANRPDGYVLNPDDSNSNTISYQSSDRGNPTDIRHFIPSNNPNIEQPSIKYIPGTQLIQIGVKRDSSNLRHPNSANYSDSNDHKKADQTMAMMPVVYYVRNNNSYQVVGSTLMAKGYAGSNFNIMPYITTDVPANYSWVGFHGDVPSTYNNNDSVGIVVAPKAKASNNQNLQQMVIMPVEYQYQGQTVSDGNKFATGTVNTKFDIAPFENNVPNNYRFAGTNDQEPQYYEPNSKVIINVVPDQSFKDVSMPISYVYNKQIVGTALAEGRSGQSFDVTPYERDVTAKGYHFDSQKDGVNAPNVYIAGYHVIINVSPNVNSGSNYKNSDAGMVQMPINYVYNNQRVGTGTAYGIVGQPLNPQQYEQTVPNGYKYINGVVSAPQDYLNGKSITINVSPVKSSDHSNSNSQQVTSYITVQWINGQNGKVSDSLTLPGNPGQSFPLAYYENSAPEGTHSTGHLISNPVTKFTANNQTVKIQVLPNQTSTQQYGTITVRCVDPDGNTVGHSDATSHKAGTLFNLLSELQFDIPSNYHFVKFLNGEGVHRYNASQQNVKIEVALNDSNLTVHNSGNNDQKINGISINSNNNRQANQTNNKETTSQPINNNVTNSNEPNSNVALNTSDNTSLNDGSNSNTYVPNSDSSESSSNDVNSVSNRGVNTNSDIMKNSLSYRDSNGMNANASQDPHYTIDPNRHNNRYGYLSALKSNNSVSGQSGNNQTNVSNNITSATNNNVNPDSNNSNDNNSSRLPQTNENSEDQELAEIGSVLTAISVGLSQLGYSMKKRHRHDN